MASKYDREREAMGLPTMASTLSTGQSKYDAERQLIRERQQFAQLLPAHQERTQQQRMQQLWQSMTEKYGRPSDLNPANLPIMQAARQAAMEPPAVTPVQTQDTTSTLPPDHPSQRNAVTRFLHKVFVDNPVMRPINYVTGKIEEYLTPDAPYFGPDGTYRTDLPTPRERVRQQNLQVTPTSGSETFDKIADVAGQVIAPLVPVAPGMGIGNIYRSVEGLATAAGSRVGTNLGSRMASEAAREALTGAAQIGAYELATGNDLREAAKSAALGAGVGAATGAAVPVVGAALRKFTDTPIGQSLTKFIQRNKSVSPELEQQTRNLFDRTVTIQGPLRPASQEQYIDYLMRTMKDEVYQRMTPPYENPDELARWLQPHLDVSLNQIRRLSYDDMMELAEEVRRNMSMYEVAKQVAKERGFNLDDIFAGRLPSIQEKVQRDLLRRTYGIYDAPNIPIRRAVSPARGMTVEPPKSRNWLENLFGGEAHTFGISPFARQGQKTRIPENPERVLDAIDVGGRPSGPDKGSLWERFYTAVVDEQYPLKRATKQITGGKEVPLERDPAKLAWLSRGWRGKADTKIQYGFMDDQGNLVAPGLKQAIEPVKNRLNDLREYAVALRSLEYEQVGLESGIPRELAERTIAKHANDAEVKAAYEALQEYITNMNQDTLVQSGIWSQEKLNRLRQEQPNYIPMYRVQEKGIRDGIEQATARRFGNVKDPTKRRTGSKKAIVDPLESIIKQTYKNQALAERNNVMRSLVELAEQFPDNELVRPVQGSKALDDVQRTLDDYILNPDADIDKQLAETLDLFKPKTVDGKKNVFTVMRNGRAEQWQILDDQLATLIAGLGSEPGNAFINAIGKATGVLKAGLVLSPDFLTKNLIRDQMSAFINSKYGYIPIVDMLSGLWSAARKDKAFWQWMASGGANGAWVSLERNYLQGQIRDITRKGILRMGRPDEVLRKLSEWTEQGTRLGEFKRGLKKGASLKEAALSSRDVTLDFSRIGSKTKGANKAIAFFNVSIQSIDRMARQFIEKPAETLVRSMIFITLPSIGLYYINHKNPKYQELPQWEKDTYWHFFVGDEIVRIPKPFEMGIIFGTFSERMMRGLYEQDPEAFEGFAEQVLEGFSPSVFPTLLVPWVEAFANKDMYTNAPIVPKREENLLPRDQYGPYTTEIAKRAGAKLNVSPRILENFVRGYTGSLGYDILQGTDLMYRRAFGLDVNERPETGVARIPGIRPFISKGLEGASKSVDDFYKEKERLTRERNSARRSTGVFTEEAKYQLYNRIGNMISELQKQVRDVQADKSLSGEEKRDRLRVLNLQIINLARQAKGEEPILE